ncbi:hypothetical protein B0J11DRAFT_515200 [Dendryphion nanum]|uniref:Uncharacterized protein n=1 Tax=Dendryphion nanum TaxID=256645 RepID=A0A9P9EJR2_9PLEO|nr:hypothetical protein B0J11DRAFT_515200 [Dendryphion nanum]
MSDARTFTVHGQVSDSSGRLLVGYIVEAYDVDLRHEQLLGQAKTAPSSSQTSSPPQGTYSITYSSASFRRSEKGTADLRVKVFPPICPPGTPREPTAVSEILFNAPVDAVVDLVVVSVAGKTPCEFDLLVQDIKPLLDGVGFEDLVEDDTHKDITFLAGETAQDADKIRDLAGAFKAAISAPKAGISAELFYGIYRQNLPSDPKALVTLNIDAIMEALEKSIDENLINQRTSKELSAIRTSFYNLISKLSLSDPENPGKPSALQDLLFSSNIKQPQHFLDAFANHEGPVEDFWKKLEADPEFKGKTGSIQFGLQLGLLTLNHAPLLKELQARKQNGGITSVRDLAAYSEKTWLGILQKPEIGVPDIVTGVDQTAKIKKMATAITNLLEDVFPTPFVAARFSDSDDDTTYGPLETKPDLATFFKANPTFDLKTTRLTEYLTFPSSTLEGVKNTVALKNTVRAIQRLYAVAPRYAQMRPLVANGLTSSLQISKMGRTAFQLRYADTLGGEAEALHVYERARKTNAAASSLLMDFGFAGSKVFPAGIWKGTWALLDVDKRVPDLETLFGGLDMCVCDGCRYVGFIFISSFPSHTGSLAWLPFLKINTVR